MLGQALWEAAYRPPKTAKYGPYLKTKTKYLTVCQCSVFILNSSTKEGNWKFEDISGSSMIIADM